MKKRLIHAEVIALLQSEADVLGSRKALAEKLNVSQQYLGDVMNDKREPGKKILKAIKLRKIVSYESEAE